MRFWGILAIAAVGILPSALAQENDSNDTVIFLHNAWYENNKAGEAHPKFGAYDFNGIVASLAPEGAAIAPKRGPRSDPNVAAANLVAEIGALIAAGREPGSIKVIGASKGAYIAQLASAQLNRPEIRWVLVGGCHAQRTNGRSLPQMTGKVLSIYDNSDTVAGACRPYSELFQNARIFEEVEISTGRDHGFQFTADERWITPARSW